MVPSRAAWALVLAAGCATPAPDDAVEPTQQPIFGGQVATACQWPTTVLLNGCTGTLVHPSIVTTAAHCGTGHRTAIFGETAGMPARRVAIEYCRTFRAMAGVPAPANTLRDWAFCKLKEPVTDVPIVPILMGCETDILKPGQKVVVAGFGASTSGGNDGFGTKRFVETTVNRVDTGRGIQVGGMGKAPCFGDSGGPAFVKLADGTWRVFGIDSSGLAASCDAGDLMALIHKGVPWIEQQSGIDITPCHDADGTWNPSPACRGFSLAPDSEGRGWSNGCAEPARSPPAATCGPATTAEGDAGPAAADAGNDLAPPDLAPPAPPDAQLADDASADSLPPAPDAAAVPRPPDAATAGPPHAGSGCSCRLGRRPTSGALPMLLVIAALARPRRVRSPLVSG